MNFKSLIHLNKLLMVQRVGSDKMHVGELSLEEEEDDTMLTIQNEKINARDRLNEITEINSFTFQVEMGGGTFIVSEYENEPTAFNNYESIKKLVENNNFSFSSERLESLEDQEFLDRSIVFGQFYHNYVLNKLGHEDNRTVQIRGSFPKSIVECVRENKERLESLVESGEWPPERVVVQLVKAFDDKESGVEALEELLPYTELSKHGRGVFSITVELEAYKKLKDKFPQFKALAFAASHGVIPFMVFTDQNQEVRNYKEIALPHAFQHILYSFLEKDGVLGENQYEENEELYDFRRYQNEVLARLVGDHRPGGYAEKDEEGKALGVEGDLNRLFLEVNNLILEKKLRRQDLIYLVMKLISFSELEESLIRFQKIVD